MHTAKWLRTASSAVLIAASLALASCGTASTSSTTLPAPKVKPPLIATAGVLRVAVDTTYPPFAANKDGAIVGMDADVAAALATQLGLKLELVDVKPDELGKALRGHKVDVGLGAIPITQAALSDISIAGSYLIDGPALFARDASVTVTALAGVPVAVQKGSQAYWALNGKPGAKLVVVPTLRDAFVAMQAGKAGAVAGDALVAGYIRRDFSGVRFAGQLGAATPLGVSVAADAQKLGAAVSDAMDTLAGTGVLDAVRSKWEGDLPALAVGPSSDASSAVATASAAASGTP